MYAIRSYYGAVHAEHTLSRKMGIDPYFISGGGPGPHKIQGIGAGFVPENLDTSLLDGVERVSEEETRITSYNVCYTKLLRSRH